MKLGSVSRKYFLGRYAIDTNEQFAHELQGLQNEGFLAFDSEGARLNRNGLLQVDRLLHRFFLPQHRDARYA